VLDSAPRYAPEMKNSPPHRTRFGPFELDRKTGELWQGERKLLLQEQPFRVLLMLVERPGDLITREDIQERLWPNDTIVEFDHSINTAVTKLRQALGDSAENPRFVETVARRGYRLMVNAEPVQSESEPASAETSPKKPDDNFQRNAPNMPVGVLSGKKVSHYRVLEILGGGGMGVVYRAEDLKLGRRVALKFLPEESAKDPAALGRFEREARSASALEHPNICPIYEFGEHEGQCFLVMQLLEGQTLREMISAASPGNPPLGLNKLFDLAIQITAGLDAAHRLGIIHRDIKPANIFVTSEGQAKILDFGLAKLAPTGTVAADFLTSDHPWKISPHEPTHKTESLTASSPFLSRTGVAMGTAGYMSPEQIRGEKLDARTDLFSFGLVLYEMATGKSAFAGDTGPVLQEAILKQVPTPARELNPELPAELEQIIHRALEKDRAARYHSASEVRADLEALKREIEPKHRARWWEMAAAGIVVLLLASVALWFAKRQPQSLTALPQIKLRQLTNNSSENGREGGGGGVISPDGRYLAYIERSGLHIKLIEGGETQTIPQPDELKNKLVDWEIGPWFPDGTRFLAYTHPLGGDSSNWTSRGTSTWIVPVLGGPPRKLRDEAYVDSISPDGSTLAFQTNPGRFGDREIWLMDTSGEHAHKLYDTDKNSAIVDLNWSPDGQRALYRKIDEAGQRLLTRDLKGGSPIPILSPPEANRLNDFLWLPDGRVIYALVEPDPDEHTCNYWQIRIDPRSGEPIGESRRLTNWAGFCVGSTSVTSDSKRLAFGEWRPHNSVYVADLQANGTSITTPTRLTLDEGWNNPLGWTADSKAVIFFSDRDGTKGLFKQSLGQDTAERISNAKEDGYVLAASVSPEGSWVFYRSNPEEHGPPAPNKLMRVPITGGSPQLVLTANLEGGPRCAKSPATLCAIAERSQDRKQLVFEAFDPVNGRGRELAELKTDATADYLWDLSPDGARIALLKNKEGRIQILSLNGGPPQEITVKGWDSLNSADWAAAGKGLVVSSRKERGPILLSVDLQGNARVLWEHAGSFKTYGVPSPDGRHLAMQRWIVDGNMWMMENF
jgi:serine/threonine protein kinase/Tol biopolymer transport system component